MSDTEGPSKRLKTAQGDLLQGIHCHYIILFIHANIRASKRIISSEGAHPCS